MQFKHLKVRGCQVDVIEITSNEEFNKIIETGAVLVDFNAPWCGPCRSQEPILETLATKLKGKAFVAAINIDNFQALAGKLGIRSIPALIIFKKSKEIQRFIGLQPEKILADAIENAVS
jgi:thioredoxin 1